MCYGMGCPHEDRNTGTCDGENHCRYEEDDDNGLELESWGGIDYRPALELLDSLTSIRGAK